MRNDQGVLVASWTVRSEHVAFLSYSVGEGGGWKSEQYSPQLGQLLVSYLDVGGQA